MVRATCDITGTKCRKFNDFVRGELRRRKIKQEDLADYLGVGRCTITSRLNGTIEWYLRDAINVAEFFGVTLDEIM